MTTLQKRILNEFTPKVERLMDIYARDWRLLSSPKGHYLPQDHVEDARGYMHRLAANHTFERIDRKAKKIKKTKGSLHSLAARLYDHDLVGEITYLQGMESIFRKDSQFPIDVTEAARFMRKLTTVRLFGLTMGYVASDHDSNYLSFFPSQQLEPLLTSASVKSRKIQTTISHTISNVEYVALHQIVKNAPVHWELYARNEGTSTNYIIEDLGGGIRHKDKTPLTVYDLPEIFNEFSTKDGGHGLQIARHLIHSLGGHIEVITTTENGTLRYSTRYEKAESSASNGVHGTLFSVYVPHDYFTVRGVERSAAHQISLNPDTSAPRPEKGLVF